MKSEKRKITGLIKLKKKKKKRSIRNIGRELCCKER